MAKLSSSHDHPLSPPLASAEAPPPLFPDVRPSLRFPKPFADSPLFPASPPLQADEAVEEMSRRGSVATLLGGKAEAGIGLGLPGALAGREEDYPTSMPPSRTAQSRSRRPAISSSPLPSLEDTPIPSRLTLPSHPHLLQTTDLISAFPSTHLAALSQALSRDLAAAQTLLAKRDAELAALEKLAELNGIGRGEIDRARVRARAEVQDLEGREESSEEETKSRKGEKNGGKLKKRRGSSKGKERAKEEWQIELGEFADREPEEEEKEELGEQDETPLKTEVDLDLEDLTEAISSNAFDLGLQPTSPTSLHFPSSAVRPNDSDIASIHSRALSLPPPAFSSSTSATPSTPDDQSEAASIASTSSRPSAPSSSSAPASAAPVAIKPARGRHASLSARIFGSLGASSSTSSLSGPPALGRSGSSTALSSSPTSINDPPARPDTFKQPPLPTSKTRHARSGSVKSTRSVSSTTSREGGAGYGDWLWKAAGGWGGKGKTPSTMEGKEGGQVEVQEESEEAQKGEEASAAPEEAEEPDEVDQSSSSSRRASTSTTVDTTASTLATTHLEPSTPDRPRPSPSPSISSSSHRSSPSSPTLSRTRSPAPPPPVFMTASAQGSIASTALSTEVSEGTMSTSNGGGTARRDSVAAASPAVSPEGVRAKLPLPKQDVEEVSVAAEEGEDEGEEKGQGTIKARPATNLDARHTFVPGVPLYSASSPDPSSPDAATRLAAQAARAKQDDSYVAAAKGSLTRALGLGASLSSSFPSTTSLSAVANSSTPSSGNEPNLTLFPKLPALSLSRYALFAQPALSTPATHVSLTSGGSSIASHPTNSPLVAHTAMLGGGATTASSSAAGGKSSGGANLTMELSSFSGEAAPPSLALLKPSYSSASVPTRSTVANSSAAEPVEEDEDGPMMDRYGFIVDVRSGMELLKESRRREGKKKESKSKQESVPPTSTAPPADNSVLLTPATELEVHPQLDALREAIGLTPTTENGPSTLEARAPSPSPPVSAAPSSSSAKLVRAPSSPSLPSLATLSTLSVPSDTSSPAPSIRSSSTSATHPSSGPQSMRALLVQLRTMTDAVEKTQQDAWDAFIRRRQAKLAELKKKELAKHAAATASASPDGSRSKERERPKTVFEPDGFEANEGEGEEVWTSENLVGVAQMGTEGKGKKEDWTEFKELVRKGIPIVYRPKIWAECSSANEAREPGVYQELLAQPTNDGEAPCLKQIDMDCHRTFPTNVFFAGNGPGVAKLRNVLVAYSRRNPKIGYCQGMNNLVATLLLTHPAEEDAFWVLVCIIENILPSDYYTSHLLVSRADQEVLRDLVARSLPNIAEHLEEHGVELSAITFGWFLSLFTDVLPIQTLLRVWDLFFIHGTVLLFRIALAVFKLHETDLLACDSAAAIYGLLGTLPTHLYHADRLLKVACEDLASSVKDREVSTLRSKHVAILQEQMGLAVDGEVV